MRVVIASVLRPHRFFCIHPLLHPPTGGERYPNKRPQSRHNYDNYGMSRDRQDTEPSRRRQRELRDHRQTPTNTPQTPNQTAETGAPTDLKTKDNQPNTMRNPKTNTDYRHYLTTYPTPYASTCKVLGNDCPRSPRTTETPT